MGFWARLFGREVDTTVTDHQAHAEAAPTSSQGETTPSTPERRSTSGALRFTVEDVFVISGRGTVATGRVGVGSISVGDVVAWSAPDGRPLTADVLALEAFRTTITTAGVGELVGVLIGEVPRSDIQIGSVLERGRA